MFPHRLTREFMERAVKLGRLATGKAYTEAEHGFFYDVTRRQQKEAFADILRFLESVG